MNRMIRRIARLYLAGIPEYEKLLRMHRSEYGERPWSLQIERLHGACMDAHADMNIREAREALGAILRDMEALSKLLTLEPDLANIEDVVKVQTLVRIAFRMEQPTEGDLLVIIANALEALVTPGLGDWAYSLDITTREASKAQRVAKMTPTDLENTVRRLENQLLRVKKTMAGGAHKRVVQVELRELSRDLRDFYFNAGVMHLDELPGSTARRMKVIELEKEELEAMTKTKDQDTLEVFLRDLAKRF